MPGAPFPPTRWSVVAASCRSNAPGWRERMEEFCQLYWEPVYAYVRQFWAKNDPDAGDATQAFFARLLDHPFPDTIGPEKGRFRSYLKEALRHFLMAERRDGSRQKRGGRVRIEPLDFDVPAPEESPEEFFDRMWKATLLSRALVSLEARFEREGRPTSFAVFSRLDLAGEPRPSAADVAREFSLSFGTVRSLLYEARRCLKEEIRALVRELVEDPGDADGEFEAMFGRLGA